MSFWSLPRRLSCRSSLKTRWSACKAAKAVQSTSSNMAESKSWGTWTSRSPNNPAMSTCTTSRNCSKTLSRCSNSLRQTRVSVPLWVIVEPLRDSWKSQSWLIQSASGRTMGHWFTVFRIMMKCWVISCRIQRLVRYLWTSTLSRSATSTFTLTTWLNSNSWHFSGSIRQMSTYAGISSSSKTGRITVSARGPSRPSGTTCPCTCETMCKGSRR